MEYKGYTLRKSNDIQYPFKPRPYDEADYYYAKSVDGYRWIVGYKDKYYTSMCGTFEDIVDLLEDLNESQNIKPVMSHN